MHKKTIEHKLRKLKQELFDIGIPIPGSIQIVYRRCGKKNCWCQQSGSKGHGPYYIWYKREQRKLKTQLISAEDIQIYQEWIKNREAMEVLVKKIVELGALYAVDFNNTKNNSKKVHR